MFLYVYQGRRHFTTTIANGRAKPSFIRTSIWRFPLHIERSRRFHYQCHWRDSHAGAPQRFLPLEAIKLTCLFIFILGSIKTGLPNHASTRGPGPVSHLAGPTFLKRTNIPWATMIASVVGVNMNVNTGASWPVQNLYQIPRNASNKRPNIQTT